MKKRKSFKISAFIITILFYTISGNITTNAVAANWWDKDGTRQYGGTITVQFSSIRHNFDTFSFFPGDWHMVYEALVAQEKWTIDRAEYGFKADFVPTKYFSGELAESWEMKDSTTMVFHLRKGIHWHNKPPVNGREFVASDVEAHYNRVVFSPYANFMYINNLSLLKSVKATDKYTVTVTFKRPGIIPIWQFLDQVPWSLIEAPEYAALDTKSASASAGPPQAGPPPGGPPQGAGGKEDKKGPPGPPPGGPPIMGAGGPLQDWHNIVGTGPWMMTKFVEASSMTLSKNPDYWGFDERHPQNRLPYADTLQAVVIPDISTAMAALRTGKIDILGNTSPGQSLITWQQASSLSKNNPELKQAKVPAYGQALQFRVDKAPFNDIRVRKALNMAIDRATIVKNYYGNNEDGVPAGIRSPAYKGWCFSYNEWPQGLKEIYSFNPVKAKQLLKEAGYPKGFKAKCVASASSDLQLLQILKSQLHFNINIDMEIRTIDPTTWLAYTIGKKTDQMMYTEGGGTNTSKPTSSIYRYYSKDVNQNVDGVNDPKYDALVDKFNRALSEDEAAEASKAMDKYGLEQVWSVTIFPISNYVIYQPYLKGYNGEMIMWNHWYYYTARWWIDKSLKKKP